MHVGLDDMLDLEQASAWLGISRPRLLAKTKGPRPVIPAFWINGHVVRFHVRTVIAKLQKDAGLPLNLTTASMGLNRPEKGTSEQGRSQK